MKKLLVIAMLMVGTTAFAQPVNENKEAKVELLSNTTVKVTHKADCPNSYTIMVQGNVVTTPVLQKGESGTYIIPTTDCKQMVVVSPVLQCSVVDWKLQVKCSVGLPVTFTRFSVTLKN